MFALLLVPSPPASAQVAAAPWPASAQGRALPRPAWVLVIPARRTATGDLVIWDRNDAWTKAWRVPRLVDGIRMVSLLGDAEDRRSVTADAIDGMIVSSLDVVVRKYGAPAIALAVSDGSAVAIAGYVPGYSAAWQPAEATSDVQETQRRSSRVLAGMFGGSGAAPLPRETPVEPTFDADIVDAIERTDGTFDYVVGFSVPGQGPEDLALRLEALPDARIKSVTGQVGRVRATLSYDTPRDSIADELAAAGFTVR